MAKKKNDPAMETKQKVIETVCNDTLYRISRAYKISLTDLKKLNPEISTALIRKGTKVIIG